MSAARIERAPWGTTLVIAVLSMLGPFSIDMVFPAFGQLGLDLDASTAAMQQVTSTYLLAFAVMSLLHGPLSDSLGRKPVMVVGLVGYAAASVLCAVAPSLPVLLVGRIGQGMFAGAGQIISRTVIRDLFHGPAAQRMMANVSMIFALAPAVAPIFGGWLLGLGRWSLLFWILAGFAIVMALVVAVTLPETHPAERRTPLRLRPIVTGLLRVGGDAVFQRLAFASAFAFGAQFVYVAAAPIIILGLLGKGEQDFWILFLPMITGMLIGSWLNSRLAGRISPTRLASVAFAVNLGTAALNLAVSSVPAIGLPWVMMAPPLFAGAVALAFPILQLAMLDRFPAIRGSAASLQAFITLLFNAVLTGAVVPLITGSMGQVAATSAAFSAIGAGFWSWHLWARRRATAAQA